MRKTVNMNISYTAGSYCDKSAYFQHLKKKNKGNIFRIQHVSQYHSNSFDIFKLNLGKLRVLFCYL